MPYLLVSGSTVAAFQELGAADETWVRSEADDELGSRQVLDLQWC